jgi:hypothetical protein
MLPRPQHQRYAAASGRLRVEKLVGGERQEQLRDAGRERGEERARARVGDDSCVLR